MALFKINKGLNANLPVARRDGYAYFTTDDGKFWIDFQSANGVQQSDGTTVDRKALNAERADYVGYSIHLLYNGTETEDSYNGLSAVYWDLTPAKIGAFNIVNGSTVSGPAVFNNTVTVNNDAYIDSATIGDLLVNGGTRFVGAVNAGTITASSFVGPLTGNASTATKVNHKLSLQINGTNITEFDGSADGTYNITPSAIGALSTSTTYALGDAVAGNAVKANALNVSAAIGSTTRPVYIQSTGVPAVISNTAEVDLVAKSANKVNHSLNYQLRGNDIWSYDGSAASGAYADANGNTVFNLVPNDIGIFDTLLGSTVTGEAVFNNVVYLNDETYADSLTAENEIVTGTLRVVGDLNGSIINATTFNGNATSATKVNHKLYLQINGTGTAEFDGSDDATFNVTPSAIGALPSTTTYALGDAVGGNAVKANALNVSAAIGSTTRPVYIQASGVPAVVSNSAQVDLIAKSANKVNHKLVISYDSISEVEYDGSTMTGTHADANGNTLLDITPEAINAVRRNGDTIAGPLTINGVFTVNNDAYIDSATIGDLLVNGGTRFVGAVNAGSITASSFSGPLTGNASTADKVNHALKIQYNGNEQCSFDGTALAAANGGDSNGNTVLNITPSAINAVDKSGDTMTGALTVGNITVGGASGTVAGKTIASNDTLYLNRKANTSLIFQLGGTEHARFDTSGNFIPASGSTTTIGTSSRPWANMYATTFNGNATSATKVNHQLKFSLRGTDLFGYDGSAATGTYADANGHTVFDIIPNDLGIFDTQLGSTVSGEAVFNNVVYLNDETYADSLTAENEIVTGTLRVVGDLNGSVINATTFNGALAGNASTADKVNHSLNVSFDSTSAFQYDGSTMTGTYADANGNSLLDITPQAINAVDIDGTSTMTGTLKVDNVNGVQVRAKNADKKVWEVVGSASSWNSQYGFYDLYKGSNSGNDKSLEFYADNQTGTHVKVRTVKQDGTVNWHTVNTFDQTIVGNIDTADAVNHSLNILFDSTGIYNYDGSALTGTYADENGNSILDITPEAINAVRRNGDTIPGPLTINGVTTVNNDMYIDSATVGDLLVNGGTRFVGDVNAGNITASSLTGPLTGNATSADEVNHDLKIQFNGTEQCSYNGSELTAANGGDSDGNTIVNITPFDIEAAPKVNGIYYGTCDTPQATLQKEVTLVNGTGFTLTTGAMVMVKFTNGSTTSTAANPMTLKVGSTAAAPMYRYGTTLMGAGVNTSGWQAGAELLFVYDGTGWYRPYWSNTEYIIAAAHCSTSSATAAKTVTNLTLPKLGTHDLFEVTMYYDNTYVGPITMKIGFDGPYPIYINGQPSSATNYTLPGGKYMVYFDGSIFYFNTEGGFSGPAGYVKRIQACDPTNTHASAYAYYRIGEFAITGTQATASARTFYRAEYEVTVLEPIDTIGHGHVAFVFTVQSDASSAGTFQNVNAYWSEASYHANFVNDFGYSYDASRQNIHLYIKQWSSNRTVYEVKLVSLYTGTGELTAVETSNTTGKGMQMLNTVIVEETGYSLNFLHDANLDTAAPLNSDANYRPNIYGYSGASERIYSTYRGDTSTATYYLTGVSSGSGMKNLQHVNSSYFLGGELYQTTKLHIANVIGTSGKTYGGTLPSSPVTGQLFFQTGATSGGGGLGLPTGGAAGQQLYKSSNVDGACEWSNPNVSNTSSTTVYVTGCTSTTSKQQYNSNIYMNCSTGVLMGAAWNDYAEYREADTMEPGRCIIENGDDTLSLSYERMQPGAEIVSDTFGFAIGKTGKSQTPVAASGRVLAYPYEDRNEFKPGMPVCSGPNGTVSIMTAEEAREYPWCIIGTVSAVPTYETWGQANVKVNGRIWIRIR